MDDSSLKTFIPRKRVDPRSAGLKVDSTISITNAVALLVFSIAFFISAGLFMSTYYMNTQIDSLQKEASNTLSGLDQTKIEEIAVLDRKVNMASMILKEHTSISAMLDFLQDTTVSRVTLNSFDYSQTEEDGKKITIEAEALDYNTLGFQSETYKKQADILSTKFSGIEPTENGTVRFIADIQVNDSIFLYNQN